jgi:excisionase family DNA binding protein
MFNHHTQSAQPELGISGLTVPVLSAERYAQLSGWSLASVEEQMDRGELPTLIIGKHRLVNIEALRQRAILESTLAPLRAGQVSTRHVEAQVEKPLLLSIDGTAKCLEIAAKTIRKWLSNGTCPFPTVLIGARRLVRRTDLEKFVGELGCDPIEKPPSESPVGQNIKRGRGRPRNILKPVR